MIEEESEFSRLIALSATPLQALAARFDPLVLRRPTPGDHTVDAALWRSKILIVSSALAILHIAFVWTSYLTDTWTTTHLLVDVDWQHEYLPELDAWSDSIVMESSLASLIQALDSACSYVLMVILWIVGLLLPCAMMMTSPFWILNDFGKDATRRSSSTRGRLVLELAYRGTLLIIYVLALLALASAVDVRWTSTAIRLRSQADAGLAAFGTGIVAGLLTIVALRWPPLDVADDIEATPSTELGATAWVRSPPPAAFRHAWHNDDDEVPMTVLEESPLHTPPSSPRRDDPPTPELIDEDDEHVLPAAAAPTPTLPATYCHKVCAFQLALAAVVLWMPAMSLPMIQFEYGGLAATFMTDAQPTWHLWQLPTALWRQGVEASTPKYILLLVGSIVVGSAFVAPMGATWCAIVAWMGDAAEVHRHRLYAIQPVMGGLVFCAALLLTTPSIQALTGEWIASDSSVCEKFASAVGEECLSISARLLPGAWFYLAQSIVLEVLVWFTLTWSCRQ